MNKPILLAAAAAGYVLGSRAGRERYEQIKDQALQAFRDGQASGSRIAKVNEQPSTVAPGVGTS